MKNEIHWKVILYIMKFNHVEKTCLIKKDLVTIDIQCSFISFF